eukprot:CAMPEP_0114320090 /NCGR_PEP_ID=MMETSP0059-20121206/25712_1 /TAXON_ID=36894 /ORGANISM="Pyramimonas parkeae, Strain CCMP726" /LENGTH=54 /DNA_ID=CAMNT_0001447387 /DNA_START=124 /DNA_END=288 /DNA_ORIENTATION=+
MSEVLPKHNLPVHLFKRKTTKSEDVFIGEWLLIAKWNTHETLKDWATTTFALCT